MRTIPIFIMVMMMASPVAGQDEPPLPYDGDTIYVVPTAETPACSRPRYERWEAVRVMGVDTPELKGRCATETIAAERARSRMIELLESGGVQLERHGCDRYKRTLARVFVDGRDVAETLIEEGLGRPYDGGHRDGWCPSGAAR
jgi:endonuclease YncB( thermonuclease family)